MKDSVIQTNASSSSFDFSSLFNTSDEDPEGSGGSPDISSLLNSLMGGDGKVAYLLTPPLVVKDGEALVFSAKKPAKDDSGSGSSFSFSFGSSDSTFVVERTEYSKNQWVRVADFTTALDTLYQTFAISGTPAGEYRFRFKAAGSVMIDSIAGMYIDNEAPDIYVIDENGAARDLDFSLCYADSTKNLTVINTATGTLKVAISSDDESLFTVSPQELDVVAADSMDVSVTFLYAGGKPGKNEAQIGFLPADERVYGKTLYATAVVAETGVWAEDFNANRQPTGFFADGWEFHDNVATVSSDGGGMAAMFGGGSSSFLMTPPLTVENTNEVLLFSVKKGSEDDGLGSLFGGGGPSLVVEKSVYGSAKWERVKEFTEPLDSAYRTLWIGYIEPGEYRFRILASDSIVVDSIAGFHIDNNAPDMYVLPGNPNYGMPQGNSTRNFAVVNTGTGSLEVGVEGTNESVFALDGKNLSIAASDTAVVGITFQYDEQSLGEHRGIVTFTPQTPVLAPYVTQLVAYSTYTDAWSEDFEPEFIPDDETLPREFPVGWETTGWEVTMPSSGGGLMDMLSSLMGSAGDEPKSWGASTGSAEYELITPYLQAQKGDVLRFQAEMGGGGGLMAMMSMFMGGGASGQLNVFYSRIDEDSWTHYGTYFQSDSIFFVAPYTGVYQLRFTASDGTRLDDFLGFRKPLEEIAFYDDRDDTNAEVLEKYDGQTVNVSYDRVLSAEPNGDGTWTPKAYTVCLPYDLQLDAYNEQGKVKLYQLSYIDDYYRQFIFTNVAEKAEAGRAYLVVVERGDVNLNAYNVTLAAEPVGADESNAVGDYEDWYFNDSMTPVGQWLGTFRSIPDTEADGMNMYCVRDDGTWVRFQSNPEGESNSLNGFRAYFLQADAPAGSRRQAPSYVNDGIYRTMFQPTGAGVPQTGNVSNSGSILFGGDIPFTAGQPTGIDEIEGYSIHTFDSEAGHRYFDIEGRLLGGKLQKGLFINNGRVVLAPGK